MNELVFRILRMLDCSDDKILEYAMLQPDSLRFWVGNRLSAYNRKEFVSQIFGSLDKFYTTLYNALQEELNG